MIFAFGRIRWIRPTCAKLFGILSMKNGALVLRWTRVCVEVVLAERAQLVGASSVAERRPGTARAAGAPCLPPSSRASAMMSGSSIVPSTAEWLERICSISVEPARGRPTMKIGSGAGQPHAGALGEELAA